MAPAGRHGVLNDAIAIYFNDATLASSYVARWRRLTSGWLEPRLHDDLPYNDGFGVERPS